jgi:hypothetical protein
MGSLVKRIEALESRIAPSGGSEESKWRATRQEYGERLDELKRIYWQESETIKNHTAMLQEQGHSKLDARTIARDETLRTKNPELWDWFNQSFPPELRHDPVAKYRLLGEYLERRKRGTAQSTGL